VVDRRAAVVDRQAAAVDRRAAVVDRQAAVVDRQAAVVDRPAAMVDRRAALAEQGQREQRGAGPSRDRKWAPRAAALEEEARTAQAQAACGSRGRATSPSGRGWALPAPDRKAAKGCRPEVQPPESPTG
jgi:hypothetical protein